MEYIFDLKIKKSKQKKIKLKNGKIYLAPYSALLALFALGRQMGVHIYLRIR